MCVCDIDKVGTKIYEPCDPEREPGWRELRQWLSNPVNSKKAKEIFQNSMKKWGGIEGATGVVSRITCRSEKNLDILDNIFNDVLVG